jgi:poly(hydroxyalkanoate) depolymerase family esterase
MSDDKRRPGGEHGPGSPLDAAMRGAARLTRNHHVAEATRLIRRALSGHEAPLPLNGFPRAMPPLLDRGADVDLSPTDLLPGEPAAAAAPPRPRHSLGTVLELLHRPGGGAPRLGLGVLSPASPREREPIGMPDGVTWLSRTYTGSTGSRDYRLYVPSTRARRTRALVVMLHGCTQTPDDFAAGTGMNTLAEERGLVVAYPRQATSANHSGCWNWFKPEDQARDSGEPAIIAGLTQALVQELGIDETSVFVAGLSAGGAMAAVLAATYPELYRAAGIHSGLAHGAASDLVSAFAAMRGTPLPVVAGRRNPPVSGSKAPARTIVFHGTSDQTVHPSNGDEIYASARTRLNGAAETTHHGRSAGGLSYTRKVVTDAQGRPQLEHWMIDGLGHAWSGGSPDGSYTDRLGPDASREMLRFFLAAERGES